VVAAAVTGVFGLVGGDHPSSKSVRSASGGNSSNNGACVGGGADVSGTVNCGPRAEQTSPSQIRFSTRLDYSSSGEFVVPGRIMTRPPPSGPCTDSEIAKRLAWFRSHAAVQRSRMRITVDVVNDSQQTLILQHIGLRRYARGPETTGRSFPVCHAGEGEGVGIQYIKMNLFKPPILRVLHEGRCSDDPVRFFAKSGTASRVPNRRVNA
jgi:hypothetical protein